MKESSDARRVPLGEAIDGERVEGRIDLGDFSCEQISLISEDGASGLVYAALSPDFYGAENSTSARLIIKECYPLEIADWLVRVDGKLEITPDAPKDASNVFAAYKERYRTAFANHTRLYQSSAKEQIVVPSRTYEANGTVYLISDASNGDVMTNAFKRMRTSDQIKTLIRVSEAISAIHHAGYVYLDLKPDNILCVKNPDETCGDSYTEDVKLFDFDTAVSLGDLSDGCIAISGSGDWSAYEQTHSGYEDALGPQSDIYALGALLFWVAVGRPPKAVEVINASGEWEISGQDCANLDLRAADEQALRCLRTVLNKTLVVDPSLRYKTTKPLIDELRVLLEALIPVGATHSLQHSAILSKLEDLQKLAVAADETGADRFAALMSMIEGIHPTRESAASCTEPACDASMGYDLEDISRLVKGREGAGIELKQEEKAVPKVDSSPAEGDEPTERNVLAEGYAAVQLLQMLGEDASLSDEVRQSVATDREAVLKAFRDRDVVELEKAVTRAGCIAEAAMRVITVNMLNENIGGYLSEEMASALKQRTRKLERGIINGESAVRLRKRCKRLDRLSRYLPEAIVPRMFLGLCAQYLSRGASDDLASALENFEGSLIEGKKKRIKQSRKLLADTMESAEQDAMFGVVNEQIEFQSNWHKNLQEIYLSTQ
ncbi:hypothetical protein [uncultured Adlercreutzia sp.]|uniref:protein kinase domain-containing protein n=1 Tax=uncultured Adlercreutzia sp. TaxID=875803 RepID=UPI0025FC9A0F|nr:hypothetical protein [uncultured Adlercreutzia sp.]